MFSKHQRFQGIKRNYSPETVEKLRGSFKIEYSVSRRGATKLWELLTRGGNSYVNALGALTGKLPFCTKLHMEHNFCSKLFLMVRLCLHVRDTLFPNMVDEDFTNMVNLVRGAQIAWHLAAHHVYMNLYPEKLLFVILVTKRSKSKSDPSHSRPRQPKKF